MISWLPNGRLSCAASPIWAKPDRGPRARVLFGLLIGLITAAVASFASIGPATAEGSRTLYPVNATCQPTSLAGSCRASIEWRTSSYGPAGGGAIHRRTVFSLYVVAGEVIETGSSAVGIGAGDILIWNPGVVADTQASTLPTITPGTNGFLCSAQRTASGIAGQGMITSRALESAGPQAVGGGGNPTGYIPCHYTAPSTGFYNLAMYGPAGDGADADGGPTADIDLGSASNFNATQGTSVSAWDVTVRADDTSTSDINGRLFTYALAAFTGGNGRPVNQRVYVTTTDGFQYQTDTNGLDPNGFLMYGNQRGFLDADGSTPLDHDVLGTVTGSQLAAVAGGVTFAAPAFPLSFSRLSATTLAALGIPAVPTAPIMTDLSFAGNVAGNYSLIGDGGTFSYTENIAAQYEFVISRDGVNYDPGNPVNRVLRGERPAGTNTVAWDGKDNSGNNFPVGVNYQVHARLHAGEYHFPMIDSENSTKGGPTFTLLNPPGGLCPFGNSACTTAFYDDRGYHTLGASGSDVGTPGAVLCGAGAPSPDHSDPLNGYVSTTNQRAYGADNNGNTNVPCTGSFGDVKGLDTWIFYPSTTILAPLNIISTGGAAPVATPDSGTTPVDTPLHVPAVGVLGNDSGTAITVTSNTNPGHGTVTVGTDGSYTYTPAPGYTGPDHFTYTITDNAGRTATTTVSLTVTPLAKPDSARTPEGVPVTLSSVDNDLGTGLHITAVAQPPAGTGSTKAAAGQIVYTPPAGYIGTTTFTYTVTDAAGQTTTAVDTVTVFPGPKAVNDSGSGHAGETVVVHPLTNDKPSQGSTFLTSTLRLTDPGTGKPATTVTLSGKGTFTVGTGGAVTFVPVYGFTGATPPIGYTVTDTDGQRTGAEIVVTIGPGPSAKPDHGSGHAGETVTLTPQGNDTASPGGATLVPTSLRLLDPMTGKPVLSVTVPAEGTYTVHPDGTVSFTPVAGFSGTTKPQPYTELDTYKQTADSSLTVTIGPGPAAADDTASTPPGTPVVIGPLGNDTPSQTSTFMTSTVTLTDLATGKATKKVTVPGQGSYVVDGGGVIFTPDPGFTGTTTPLKYAVTDSFDQTTGASITVVVRAALPFTGLDTGAMVASGVGLVGVGVLFLFLVRRSREQGPREQGRPSR
jgi:CshA-type fibril repeat protein